MRNFCSAARRVAPEPVSMTVQPALCQTKCAAGFAWPTFVSKLSGRLAYAAADWLFVGFGAAQTEVIRATMPSPRTMRSRVIIASLRGAAADSLSVTGGRRAWAARFDPGVYGLVTA